MATLWPLDLEVVDSLLHLWLSLITFMVVPFITFMGKFYYIYLWLVLHLWFLLHLWVIQVLFLLASSRQHIYKNVLVC